MAVDMAGIVVVVIVVMTAFLFAVIHQQIEQPHHHDPDAAPQGERPEGGREEIIDPAARDKEAHDAADHHQDHRLKDEKEPAGPFGIRLCILVFVVMPVRAVRTMNMFVFVAVRTLFPVFMFMAAFRGVHMSV
jgi:hypothetical protein